MDPEWRPAAEIDAGQKAGRRGCSFRRGRATGNGPSKLRRYAPRVTV